MSTHCWLRCAASLSVLGASWFPHGALAGEFGVGAGVVGRGPGIELLYRPEAARWRIGVQYQTTEESVTTDDPYTGTPLDKETNRQSGAFVHYVGEGDGGGWYAGIAVLRRTQTLTSLVFGGSDTTSSTDAYFGGGYLGLLGKSVFYNLGLLLSPTAELVTQTAGTTSEEKGNIDLHITVGIRF